MSESEKKEYLKAVDLVCLNCCEDTLNGEPCEDCPVRKSVDRLEAEE